MRAVTLTQLAYLPGQDAGRGPCLVTITATGQPLVWFADRLDEAVPSPGRYHFYRVEDDRLELLPIPPTVVSGPLLCPFADGRWLVASRRRSPRDPSQPSAFVYSATGTLLADFQLPDALADVQITEEGDIWVCGNDESHGSQLDCFDAEGRNRFRFGAEWRQLGLPPITDCYAMNAVSHAEVWAYYFTEFPLICVRDYRVVGRWTSGIRGARAVALDGTRALFAGSYEAPHRLYLYDLEGGAVEELAPEYEGGVPATWEPWECSGRGSRLYFRSSHELHVLDLADIR